MAKRKPAADTLLVLKDSLEIPFGGTLVWAAQTKNKNEFRILENIYRAFLLVTGFSYAYSYAIRFYRILVNGNKPTKSNFLQTPLDELFMDSVKRVDYFALQFALSSLNETHNTKPKDFKNWVKSILYGLGFSFLNVEYEIINNKDQVLADAVITARQLENLLDKKD